jgi:hypothetical protein
VRARVRVRVCVCARELKVCTAMNDLQTQTTSFETLFVQCSKSIQLALRSLHAGLVYD